MKPRKNPYPRLIFSLIVTVLLVVSAVLFSDTITVQVLVKRLLFPVLRLMGFITLGLLIGQIIEQKGWTRRVAVIARPLFSFSHLGDRCSAAFTSAFISGATANAMLVEYYEEKQITRAQLFLSNWVNQFPAFFLHLPTTVFIVVPLTGIAGIYYFILTFAATLLRTGCFLLFGHFSLPETENNWTTRGTISQDASKQPKTEPLIDIIKSRLPGRIVRIATWVLPIYALVFILNTLGFFNYLNETVAGHFTTAFIPVESMSVIVLSFAAEFTSGFAAAGALMDAGVLTTKQTVIALLIGNVLAFPIRALRHQLPRYMGIFSPKTGLQVLLSGQLFRIISIIIIGLVYFMVA